MPRRPAPMMPTERQIKLAYKVAKEIDPAARISRIGPEGVTFDYPSEEEDHSKFKGRSFGASV